MVCKLRWNFLLGSCLLLQFVLLGCARSRQSSQENWFKRSDSEILNEIGVEQLKGCSQQEVEKHLRKSGFTAGERKNAELYFKDASNSRDRKNLGVCDHQVFYRRDSVSFVTKVSSVAVVFKDNSCCEVLFDTQCTGP